MTKALKPRLHLSYFAPVARVSLRGRGRRQHYSLLFTRLLPTTLGRLPGFTELLLVLGRCVYGAPLKRMVPSTLAFEPRVRVRALLCLLFVVAVAAPFAPPRTTVRYLLFPLSLLRSSRHS